MISAKVSDFCDPLTLHPNLEPIYAIKFTQPPLLRLLSMTPFPLRFGHHIWTLPKEGGLLTPLFRPQTVKGHSMCAASPSLPLAFRLFAWKIGPSHERSCKVFSLLYKKRRESLRAVIRFFLLRTLRGQRLLIWTTIPISC